MLDAEPNCRCYKTSAMTKRDMGWRVRVWRLITGASARRAPRSLAGAIVVGLYGASILSAAATAEPVAVQKTNPMKVYMHYMPWFQTPQTLGGQNWGFHWKFNNRNPNVVDADGRRQIASHYYPKIGPYDSSDADVIEYHMLLMKYAGVDGLMLDWYGVEGSNGDIGSLLSASNAIVDRTANFGLNFSVVMEDRFSANIDQAKANVGYLRDHYFNRPNYIRQGAAADPLLTVFGPITFQQPAQWTQILAEAGEDVEFLTLWYESQDAGVNADGEYSWIYEDENLDDHLSRQSSFLVSRAPTLKTAGGLAYPGFNDYYQEGGLGNVVPFEIAASNGQTLAQTLSLAKSRSANIDFLQLATFNDYGEGTMLEPTVETGFSYLVQLQQFTGVPYTQSELELVYRLYRERKSFAGNAAAQALLDQASTDLASLNVAGAQSLLDQLAPQGDFDSDGDVDGADLLKWQQQVGATGLYPLKSLAADGNADGVVNSADLALWQNDFAQMTSAALSAAVIPEPQGASLLLTAAIVLQCMRPHAISGGLR
jgi:hypothetical protein